LITFSPATRRHVPQDSSLHSYCRDTVQYNVVRFICLLCLIFLKVVLFCQSFPSDAAERELFQVSFCAADSGRGRSRGRGRGRGRGIGCSSSEVKQPELEAEHSSTSCAEVTNERSCACTPTECCHVVQRRIKFYLGHYGAS
jgi:hypothetical protein